MRKLFLSIFILTSAAILSAADAPSETDLAGITYFAPICPFYFRMMGPDGQLREFKQMGKRTFHAPVGWSAKAAGDKVIVEDPEARRYIFKNGRLAVYENEGGRHAISYPIEPCYGGRPPSLWGVEPEEANQKSLKRQFARKTNIWRGTGRFLMGFQSPNAAGGLLACLALVGVSLFLGSGKVRIALGVFVSVAALVGLVMTGSRGGLIAFGMGFVALLVLAFLRRAVQPAGRRILVLLACLAVAAGAVLAWKGTGTLTRSLAGGAAGRGEGSDRISIVSASLRMMADAPGGWGVRNAGPAYSNWYQPMGGNTWQLTLVSDQLTRLVGYGWLGRGVWIFGWLAVLSLLWTFARRGCGDAGFAVVLALAVASGFNMMLAEQALWTLPLLYGGWFVFRMVRGEFRAWRAYVKSLAAAVGASAVLLGALFAVCTGVSPSEPRVRYADGAVTIGAGKPEVCVVDDGEVLGGIYAENLLRRHYIRHPQAPAAVYCRSLGRVPAGCRRLVLAGRQAKNYLTLLECGMAPSVGELAFVSPPFAPKDLPQASLANVNVGILLGEFAARYVDVYGEGPHPAWVTLVKGAELYIPDWPEYVIGRGR